MRKIYTLAEIRNGTGFDKNAMFVLLEPTDLNPPSSATKDGVTIIDGTDDTEVCDECGMTVPSVGDMVSPFHSSSCSLHPANVVEPGQEGYTTLQAIGGILGIVAVILGLIVLATPPLG